MDRPPAFVRQVYRGGAPTQRRGSRKSCPYEACTTEFRSATRLPAYLPRHVTCQCRSIQASPGESDITIWTQEVDRRPGDVGTRKLPVIGGIAGNDMDAQQVA